VYLLKMAWLHWARQPFTQLLTTLSLTALLWGVFAATWFERATGPLLARVQTDRQMMVFFSPHSAPAEDPHRVDAIRMQLGAHAVHVDSLQYRGVQDFLNGLQQRDADLMKEIKALGQEMSLVVPRTVTLRGSALDRKPALIQGLQSVEGVERVDSSEAESSLWAKTLRQLRRAARAMWIALAAVALIVLMYQARFQFQADRKSMEILEMLGAPAWARWAPRWIQGALLGASAAMLAWMVWCGFEPWAIRSVGQISAWSLWSDVLRPLPWTMGLWVPMAAALGGALVWSRRA
jgi:cell division protein FtsX